MRKRHITRNVIALAAATLLISACGGSDLADQAQELADTARQAAAEADAAAQAEADATAAEVDDDTDGDGAAAAAPNVDLSGLMAQPPSGTVYQRGFEFTVTGLEVIDLDQQHADETGGEVEARVRGFELITDLDVFNATPTAGAPMRTAVSLQWNEPGTENVISLRGNLEVREIPSLASSSAQVVFPVPVADAELMDVDSAAMVFGEMGRSAAVLPLGSQPELVTRLPVDQPTLEGVSFDVDGVQMTITNGRIFHETRSDGPLPDDEVLLELTYEIDNSEVDAQTCSPRGTGSWSLVAPDGTGVVDLGVSERCVRGGQVEREVLTGFVIGTEYGGEYALAHERGGAGQEFAGETSITLEEGDGSTHAERNE